MRIFLDIGAHEGQTLAEVGKPRWGFDLIYAVEPMPREFRRLVGAVLGDARMVLSNFALSNAPGMLNLYGSNDECETSMFPEKEDVDTEVVTEVLAVRATDYITEIPDGDLFVKINAEGAEVPILRDLLASGAISRIDHLLVDFDIRKIPGWESVADEVIDGLREAGITWREGFPYGINHQARIASWLAGEGL